MTGPIGALLSARPFPAGFPKNHFGSSAQWELRRPADLLPQPPAKNPCLIMRYCLYNSDDILYNIFSELRNAQFEI